MNPAQPSAESFRVAHSLHEGAHAHVVSLLTGVRRQVEFFGPQRKIRVHLARAGDQGTFQVGGQRVAHINHDAIHRKSRLIMRDDFNDFVPQRPHNVFGARQLRGIHAHGVVGDVIEVRMVIEPQIGHIRPGRLLGIRPPIAERAGDAHRHQLPRARVRCQAVPGAIFHADGFRRGRGGEHVAIDVVRGEKLVEAALTDRVIDGAQLLGREDWRTVGVLRRHAGLAVGHVGANPIKPFGMFLGPRRVLGRRSEHKFNHHANAQMVRRLDKRREFRFDIQPQRRFRQMLIQCIRIANGKRATHVALVAILANGRDWQQMNGIASQRANEWQQCDGLQKRARFAPTIRQQGG